jgi:hypothetical protein
MPRGAEAPPYGGIEMRRILRWWMLAAMLASVSGRAASLPVGAWEGAIEGRKAVSLEVRDAPQLHGSIVFYILHDQADGSHNGSASPALPMEGLKWDGEALRFFVDPGDGPVRFEMRAAGEGRAVLKRLAAGDAGEVTLELKAVR